MPEKNLLEKILVPLDGSELADRVLSQVKRLLVRHDAEVMLLRVITPLDSEREKVPGQSVDVAQRHLDGVAATLRNQGSTVKTEIVVGEPAARIVSFASEYGPSVIAMSTHGRTGLARWVRGSVAERVLRVSRHPVLVANPFGLAEREEMRLRRILVPLDGSKSSAEIIPLVNALGRVYESEVFLHSSIDIPQIDNLVYPITLSTDEAQALLEPYRDRFPGLRVHVVATVGSAAATILEVAEREKIDLIAMTTHGRTGASRWAFGSVAEQVIRHAKCPLLVNRTGALELQE